MKLFHLGLCVAEYPNDGLRNGLLPICSEYRELNCGVPDVNEKALRIVNEFKPDLVFMQIQASGKIYTDAFAKIADTGAKIINWTGDVRDGVPDWMIGVAPYCISAFSNMRDVHTMRSLGCKSEYLEIGYDPKIFTPEGDVTEIKPIVFFGNHYGNQFPMSSFRMNMINSMRTRPDFGVYGNVTGADGNFNSSQLAEASAYRGAKIAINCSHYEIEKYSSDRLLRILGTGVFCLCKEYPGMPFKDGVHLRTWRTIEELHQLCDYYMAHSDEREQIARQGHQLALDEYTYRAMGENLLEIYNLNKS